MRVLLVAPRKGDLAAVDAEVQDILRSGMTVTPIVGHVTGVQLLREIRDGDYDVLWLATHGNSGYVELSGNERVTAEELVPLVRGRFNLVVLNTCSGWDIAQMLQLQANVGVIFSLINTPDDMAYKFGSLLSVALVEQPTVTDAYLATVLGNSKAYHYFPSLRTNPSAIEAVSAKLDELNNKVSKELIMYRRYFAGSTALHVVELVVIAWLLWGR
jgi:hypothetical protein